MCHEMNRWHYSNLNTPNPSAPKVSVSPQQLTIPILWYFEHGGREACAARAHNYPSLAASLAAKPALFLSKLKVPRWRYTTHYYKCLLKVLDRISAPKPPRNSAFNHQKPKGGYAHYVQVPDPHNAWIMSGSPTSVPGSLQLSQSLHAHEEDWEESEDKLCEHWELHTSTCRAAGTWDSCTSFPKHMSTTRR